MILDGCLSFKLPLLLLKVRELGVQSETLPKTETSTEPILDEDGSDSGETREVITVVEGETIDNPDYAPWQAAWSAVDEDFNQ